MNPIFKRSSVRQFTEEPVSIEAIEQLMRAAMAAPSAGNQQPWEFFIVRDETTRMALSTCSPYAAPVKHAPCVVVVCTRTSDLRFPQDAPYDMSAATENLLLEATALDLGACWLGIAPERDRMTAVQVALGMPKTLEPFALVVVGHPASEPEPKGPSRYDETRVHWV